MGTAEEFSSSVQSVFGAVVKFMQRLFAGAIGASHLPWPAARDGNHVLNLLQGLRCAILEVIHEGVYSGESRIAGIRAVRAGDMEIADH